MPHLEGGRSTFDYEEAATLGFKPCGTSPHGQWQHAQVICVVCGKRLPWYHTTYQQRHRARCAIEEVSDG